MADETVTSEHAREYVRLVKGGGRPGGDTMRQARTNVAHRYAGAAAEDSAIEAAGGGPEDPVADAGAVANTLRRAAGAARSSAGAAARGGASGLSSLGSSVSTPSSAADTITKLVWAAALGLIVLEVASEATGQFWDFRLPAAGSLTKSPYSPLYAGQALSQPGSAMPGVFGAVPASSLTQRALASATPHGGFLP